MRNQRSKIDKPTLDPLDCPGIRLYHAADHLQSQALATGGCDVAPMGNLHHDLTTRLGAEVDSYCIFPFYSC